MLPRWFTRIGRRRHTKAPAIPQTLLTTLKSRVVLNVPATEEMIQFVERALGGTISPVLREIYATFNGFSEADTNSLVDFWSLENVLQDLQLKCVVGGETLFAIGDVLIHSQYVYTNVMEDGAPVYLTGVNEPYLIAENPVEYIRLLTQGEFDI